MNNLLAPILALALLVLLFVIERLFPLRKNTRSLLGRLVANLVLSALAFVAAVALVQPAVQWALRWSADKPFGLLHLFSLPVWAEFALSFLLMDLAFYYWHVANHRVPFLWRFHNVHHIDPDLDVSTAFRFHFGEIALSTVFSVVQVSFIGISPWAFAAYHLVFQTEVLFHHSNWRLPIGFERLLSLVFVTPRMHGIHHSQVERENKSNFGTVFTWWDRLHRTLGLNISQNAIVVGVPGYSRAEDNTAANALLMPFRKQRDYWRGPDGTVVDREKAPADSHRARLAE
ncbi:MAG TPA: sterol desaturase family protein [Chthoniobacterales bacterium]|nr:sterol desaturase family protein [Chthoniobacterales bacterium]